MKEYTVINKNGETIVIRDGEDLISITSDCTGIIHVRRIAPSSVNIADIMDFLCVATTRRSA